MKKILLLFAIVLLGGLSVTAVYSKKAAGNQTIINEASGSYLEGDIIFQSSQSRQCTAVKLATHSEYSHVGMITIIDSKPYVLEAIEPVCITPLADWIARGTGGHYTVMRLKNRDAEILDSEIQKERSIAKKLLNIHYDLYFNWSDDQLYCSELVWKVYQRAFGVELCSLRKMKDFDLSAPEVKAIMKQRYGDHPPLGENVVAPSDLANSAMLIEIEKK